MSVGKILSLIGQVEAILTKHGILDSAGNAIIPLSITGLASTVADVETILKADGLVIQADVDKIIAALPLILALLGVK